MDTVLPIIALVLGSSVLGSALTAWFGRRKGSAEIEQLKAERESIEVATAQKVVELVGGQFESLTAEIEQLKLKIFDLENRLNVSDADRQSLREQVERLHTHIDSLEALLRAEGVHPPPRPRPYGGGGGE